MKKEFSAEQVIREMRETEVLPGQVRMGTLIGLTRG
jgi:hypothetical protein